MNGSGPLWADQLWADPHLVYTVAAAAVVLLIATIWLFQRGRRSGRQAGWICLIVSVALHAVLLFMVPGLSWSGGGKPVADEEPVADPGLDEVMLATFDPDLNFDDSAAESEYAPVAPLPVASLADLIARGNDDPVSEDLPEESPNASTEPELPEILAQSTNDEALPVAEIPPALKTFESDSLIESTAEIDSQLSDLLETAFAPAPPAQSSADETPVPEIPQTELAATPEVAERDQPNPSAAQATIAEAAAATVPGELLSDFANRTGNAKQRAIENTGGDEETEAAVEAAIRYIARNQQQDGSWSASLSGAGQERSPLGVNRRGAGANADTAITGLALLTMIGAGHTHQDGEFADNVFDGLAYLIRNQKTDGSLAGNASVYAANYGHGMAALAVCEAAAITGDPAAVITARRAVKHTRRMQHPVSGGWRYTQGDQGDLSQLGWQAMVLDAANRAKIPIERRTVVGVQRFLDSVRIGSRGGLASYRPGEAPSRTMTAEALATRLLIGHELSPRAVAEAERYILEQLPGTGKDNYYYWYYATLALHQLQDEGWERWNEALKQRLLSTQRADGSWSSDTLWGGYGGTVYTTSMATLCLETYYRHAIRMNPSRIAAQPSVQTLSR